MLSDRRWRTRKTDCFTLQWHLTHACEYACAHCYDRSRRDCLSLERAVDVVEQLLAFCASRKLCSQLCFTGGNPVFYPHFFELYAYASERVNRVSILGNPLAREQLERIIAIRAPAYYQVSLEGLDGHNDSIRGAGHFARTLQFLSVLRELGVPSHVMLTLTQQNCSELLPLAEQLRHLADHFTFNRLSEVGNGAALLPCSGQQLEDLYRRYLHAMRNNPILRLKDNLFNVIRAERGGRVFGGCTGHGCGAAFNFLALLPDGELHACRKFPSPVGDVVRQGLEASYRSPMAKRYRTGCTSCRWCRLRNVCGGCLAVTYGRGLDPLRHRDPDCRRGLKADAKGTLLRPLE